MQPAILHNTQFKHCMWLHITSQHTSRCSSYWQDLKDGNNAENRRNVLQSLFDLRTWLDLAEQVEGFSKCTHLSVCQSWSSGNLRSSWDGCSDPAGSKPGPNWVTQEIGFMCDHNIGEYTQHMHTVYSPSLQCALWIQTVMVECWVEQGNWCNPNFDSSKSEKPL